MTLYSVAGLSTKIELPVPLIIDLIPTWQTNQRPGIKRRTPGKWVQHETANYAAGADAAMHNTWLHNGADGNQLSFHFCVDDGVIYQMLPVDEVSWQAADGAGPGNMAGVSCELCVNKDGDKAKARTNAEALAGGVIKALGMPKTPTRHYDYNQADPDRHFCPHDMMVEGYWPTFVQNVEAIAGATTEAAVTPYAISWDFGDVGPQKLAGYPAIAYKVEVTAKKPVKLRVGASAKEQAGPEMKIGDKAIAYGVVKPGGTTYLIVDPGDGQPWRAVRHAFVPKFLPVP